MVDKVLQKIDTFAPGKITYTVIVLALLYALSGWLIGFLNWQQAMQIFFDAGIGFGIRRGWAK